MSDLDNMFNVNCCVLMVLSYYFLLYLFEWGKGGFIIILFVEVYFGVLGLVVYFVIKFFVKILGEVFYGEMVGCGVDMLVFCFGLMDMEVLML